MTLQSMAMSPAKPIQYKRRPFSRAEYGRLVEVGVLGSDDRVELIEGEIVEMTPMKSPHAACLGRLVQVLPVALQRRVLVTVQTPLRLGDLSEPEPDLMLLKPVADFYESQLPEPADVLLVIEIADTSLDFDREVKMPLYARHGIPEAWLIDLTARRVEVYRQPGPLGYKTTERVEGVGTLPIPGAEGVVISLSDIVGLRP